MGTMLHQLKSSLAEFAESDEVAMILKQMLQVRSEQSAHRPAPCRSSSFAFSSVTALLCSGGRNEHTRPCSKSARPQAKGTDSDGP